MVFVDMIGVVATGVAVVVSRVEAVVVVVVVVGVGLVGVELVVSFRKRTVFDWIEAERKEKHSSSQEQEAALL